VVAFAAGFLGAANAKRLSIPELTFAIMYFGIPVPLFMTLMHHVGWLMLQHRLPAARARLPVVAARREPAGARLLAHHCRARAVRFIGINLGFVATASGKFDLRASYESFIAVAARGGVSPAAAHRCVRGVDLRHRAAVDSARHRQSPPRTR
jgi:lipoprotein-releasing system permease protein